MKLNYLLATIPFHFNNKKIKYLYQTTQNFLKFSKKVELFIITNTKKKSDHNKILNGINKNIKTKIIVPNYLGHPYFLTWIHLDIFRQKLNKKKISHFLYIEDDIQLTVDNIKYWFNGRKKLKKYGLIPSFLRYEINTQNNEKYSVDVLKRLWFHNLRKIKISKKYYFLNLPQPYQGLYLLDRILLKEHLNGLSSHPDNIKHLWNIRERAAQGVTFSNVPKKFYSRNLIGYDYLNRKIDSDCLVHHLQNNYIKKKDIFSRIKIKDLIKKLF